MGVCGIAVGGYNGDLMKTLSIDIETYSDIDLKKCGVYKYTESPNFEILLFGYSVDGQPPIVVDLACGEQIPDEIISALTDPLVIKTAYNAMFERICISRYLGVRYLDPSQWHCTMVWAATLGLPMTLAGVGAVLGLDKQKMSEGKELIRFFCIPDKEGFRHHPQAHPGKWDLFKEYNCRDVEVEIAIQQKLSRFPVPDFIWKEYHLDQQINDRGIAVDMELVTQAIRIDEYIKDEISAEIQALTMMDNPNSVVQMKEWLAQNGMETESLGKQAVKELLETAPPELAKVLSLRQQLAKSSVKKYTAMLNAHCADNRIRGMFQFYGANRSGRFSGRLVQLQNLYRNTMEDLDTARDIVKSGDIDTLELLYDNLPDILSQLIRTALIPQKPYKRFIVADFTSIEGIVLSWLAKEQWRLDVFENGGDIYCISASKMFGVPVEKHGANSHLRQKGKVAELACIAEGQPVLTNHGLIPIEKVTTDDLVWDGESWVQHDGVIYKGECEVITYEGLTATPDHLVWVEGQSEPVQFGIAAACGAHLIQTGDGGKAIQLGENYQCRKAMERENESLLCADRMCWLWQCAMNSFRKSDSWKVQRLSAMLPTAANPDMAGQTAYSGETEMRKSKRQRLSQLRCKRYSIRLSERHCSGTLSDTEVRTSQKRNGDRPNRQQWKLRTGKHSLCNAYRKQSKQAVNCTVEIRTAILAICTHNGCSQAIQWNDERRNNSRRGRCCCEEKKMLAAHIRKARLYDIRNAGRHHRFTVSGKLVHNCGYGGSIGAMKAMGADSMGLSDDEIQQIVTDWREASPNIVKLWWNVDRAVKKCVAEKTETTTHGLRFSYESGFLFIELPSGRRLAYVKPRIGENKFGGESVTYMGIGNQKKWERIESYGPKFVENIIQAIARDILLHAMMNLKNYRIVAHVHDEIIIEAEENMTVDEIVETMCRTPKWAKGLPLKAAGYECPYYMKD